MKNRWSDAARAAALAVRKARAFAANPQDKGKAVPQPGGRAPKPMAPKPTVFAGGSATFDESTGKRIPEKNIWIPPPNDPHWNDPAFVESFKRGVAERKKTGLAAGTFPTQPNIFYSSAVPGPLDRQVPQEGIRYDPKNPDHPQSPMPPQRPPAGGVPKAPVRKTEIQVEKRVVPKNTVSLSGGVKTKAFGLMAVPKTRFVIAGKRYTKVGNKLVPDVDPMGGVSKRTS